MPKGPYNLRHWKPIKPYAELDNSSKPAKEVKLWCGQWEAFNLGMECKIPGMNGQVRTLRVIIYMSLLIPLKSTIWLPRIINNV